jgi:hypothetical protein
MANLFSDYLLLAWILISISAIGIALCHRFSRWDGIELIGYGLAAGVVSHGIFGLLIAVTERLRIFFIILPIACVLVSIFYFFKQQVWTRLFPSLTRHVRISLLMWLLFLTICTALTHFKVHYPAVLPDGRYVFKKHTLNVKIQVMTSLPADNYIPYVVTEYLLRDISFRDERPIVPGNEVSNRTILMSLVAMPFRAALSWPDYGSSQLGRFDYVGTSWPDVEKLYDRASFQQFLLIGIFLNSLLLVGLIVLFSNFQSSGGLAVASLLFMTNLYAINQTLFTWPKAIAGFFIVLSWNAVRRNYSPMLVGLCAAMAFHCHPSSIAVVGGLGLWYASQSWRRQRNLRPILEFSAASILAILPWIIWTRYILRIPSNLIAQNFAGGGSAAAMASPINFMWIRLNNAFTAFAPMPFSVYPFNLHTVLNYATVCLPFVVGIFLIGPALLECWRLRRKERMLVCYGLALPAFVILGLFSYSAVPVLHGWQPMIGTVMFLAVIRLRRTLSTSSFVILVSLQLSCNLAVLMLNGVLLRGYSL